MSIVSCTMGWEDCEIGNNEAMTKKNKKEKALPPPQSLLAEYLQAEKKKSGMTLGDLEEATGIPTSTISRILAGGNDDIRLGQVTAIIVALRLPFWKAMARAGITDEIPGDPSEEAKRIASIIADEPELKSTMGKMTVLNARDRRAVRIFVEGLAAERDHGSDPQSPE